MKIAVFFLYSSIVFKSFSGGVCSRNEVKPIQRHYSYSSALVRGVPEVAADQKIKREKEIRYAVSNISLPVIFILHERMDYDDYGQLNMNHQELEIFRAAVASRYNDNIVEINHLVRDSIERHRQNVHRLSVIKKNLNRRRRLAWRSEDYDKFSASRATVVNEEEKRENN